MFTATWAGLRARRLRLAATAIAIVLSVSFVVGTLIFADTSEAAMFDALSRNARNVDVSVLHTNADVGNRWNPNTPVVPLSVAGTVRDLPGVAVVEGRFTQPLPMLDRNGKLVSNFGRSGCGISIGTDPRLRPFDLTDGRLPTGPAEAALDTKTSSRTGHRIGDSITVLDSKQGKHVRTVVGIVDFGSARDLADRTVVALTEADLVALTGATGYQQIAVIAADGVSQATLAGRIRAAVPANLRVDTGERYRMDLANAAVRQANEFRLVLLIFAIVAGIVAVFVIYNTFNILLAQRVRETALLRCVGADRRQIFSSVLVESAVVGLAGSVVGLLLGCGVAYGLRYVVGAIGPATPAHGLVVGAQPVLIGILLGVLATVGSALVPALRATRVPPLAALRVTPLSATEGLRGRIARVLVALPIAGLGTLMTVVGMTRHNRQQSTILLVIGGGVVNFLAVVVLLPLFVGILISAVGWLPGRLFGVPTRLAATNARRVPGRAAATSAALMIGVGMMAATSVTTATTHATTDRQIAEQFPVDYLVENVDTGDDGSGIPAEVVERLRADRRLDLLVQVRTHDTVLRGGQPDDNARPGTATDGKRLTVGAIDPAGLAALPPYTMASGSFSDLRPGTVILAAGGRASAGRKVGDRVRIDLDGGGSLTLTVVGLSNGYGQTGDALLHWDDMAKVDPAGADDGILIRARDGVSTDASRAAVEAVTNDFPLLTLSSVAEVKDVISSAMNSLIAVVAALLAFAIVIALIGIVNTLSLSVLERTRESAMCRALGLTAGQLRASLFAEAILVACVGALVGTLFGVGYGLASTKVLFFGYDPVMVVPIGQLLAYIALATAAGAIAAVLPARRAARTQVIAALAET